MSEQETRVERMRRLHGKRKKIYDTLDPWVEWFLNLQIHPTMFVYYVIFFIIATIGSIFTKWGN